MSGVRCSDVALTLWRIRRGTITVFSGRRFLFKTLVKGARIEGAKHTPLGTPCLSGPIVASKVTNTTRLLCREGIGHFT